MMMMNNNQIERIKNKILTYAMGAYDIDIEGIEDRTKATLHKIIEDSKTIDEIIDKLMHTPILTTIVIIRDTGEKWDITKEPLVLFLSSRTNWNFMLESFKTYYNKVRTEGSLASILFDVDYTIDSNRKKDIKEWLLS